MIDIGRVFSTGWAMLRGRFWLLAGMWAVFFAIQIAGSFALGIGMVVLGAAGAASIGAGFDDPAALAGMGIGAILFMLLFYAAYIVIALAQQAAMVTLASPLEEPAFGAALARGFKSALPFLAIALLMLLGYVALAAAAGAVVGLAGAAGGSALGIGLAVLFVPVLVYLGCRFAVLVPVVAVDQVFNPVAALRRSWAVTRGKVVSILLAIIAFIVVTLVVLGAPFLLIFGGVLTGADSAEAGGGLVILGVLVFIPVLIVYTMFASAFTAALHSEVTAGGAEALGEVFA